MRAFTLLLLSLFLVPAMNMRASDYSYQECAGSATPYPKHIDPVSVPDSLRILAINHVGRHGARYPSSSSSCETLLSALQDAEQLGTLSSAGRQLMALTERIMEESAGQWGQLDSLGMAEQREIAARMYVPSYTLFGDSRLTTAVASFKPRCVMSMYEFLHQISLLASSTQITTASGPQTAPLLRFFDTDTDYLHLLDSKVLDAPLDSMRHLLLPEKPACAVRAVGSGIASRKVAEAMYAVVSGAGAMEIEVDPAVWFTPAEYNALWQLRNLKQYLHYSASSISSVPAQMAAPLLADLIASTDSAIAGTAPAVQLRFGHAETMMPLLSLMRIPGAYYITDDFSTVADHWRNFDLVPMASNLRILIFTSPSGRKYARIDLNEVPRAIMPDSDEIYVEWNQLRSYLSSLLPDHF